MKTSLNYPNAGEVLKELRENTPAYWRVELEYPAWISVTHSSFISDTQDISLGNSDSFWGWNDQLQHGDNMEGVTDTAEIVRLFWEQVAEIYPELLKGYASPFCNACGTRHDVGDCDLEIDEELENFPTTCPDFVEHPHILTSGDYCYTCRIASASENLLPIAEDLIRAGVKRVRIEQTGGFCMVIFCYSESNESAICINEEVILYSSNLEDDEGEEVIAYCETETPEEWRALCVALTLENLYRLDEVKERAELKEYEVQVSINAFAYVVVKAENEENAEEVASELPRNAWSIDYDFSSRDDFQVREMDGEGGYMTAEDRHNSKN